MECKINYLQHAKNVRLRTVNSLSTVLVTSSNKSIFTHVTHKKSTVKGKLSSSKLSVVTNLSIKKNHSCVAIFWCLTVLQIYGVRIIQ